MSTQSGGSYTAHHLDCSQRILDYEDSSGSLTNSEAIKDFKNLIQSGVKKEMHFLKEENRILKQNLLSFQDMINKAIEESLRPLQQCLRNKDMLDHYNQLVKQYRITNTISSMQLNIPQTPQSSLYILNLFKENIVKFKQYT